MFGKEKSVALADIAAIAVMRCIPNNLIFNWDQTGLLLFLLGNGQGTKLESKLY